MNSLHELDSREIDSVSGAYTFTEGECIAGATLIGGAAGAIVSKGNPGVTGLGAFIGLLTGLVACPTVVALQK